ncbi:hypothetical protein XAB3213_4140004 [Xanthomonas citri pv. bilvae]|nr:hypothetical protein XAB3213_4140004 [Xanthomonas citri pv. bilvae]
MALEWTRRAPATGRARLVVIRNRFGSLLHDMACVPTARGPVGRNDLGLVTQRWSSVRPLRD